MGYLAKRIIFLYFSENPYKNGVLFFVLNIVLAIGVLLIMTGYFAIVFFFGGNFSQTTGFVITSLLAYSALSLYMLSCLRIWYRTGEEFAAKHSPPETLIIAAMGAVPFGLLFSTIPLSIFPYLFSIWVVFFGLTGIFAAVSKEMYHVSAAMIALVIIFGLFSIGMLWIDPLASLTPTYAFSLVQPTVGDSGSLPFVLDVTTWLKTTNDTSAIRILFSYGVMLFIMSMLSLGSKRMFFMKSPLDSTEEFITAMQNEDN